MKHRLCHRCMIIHTLIALISPKKIGLINASTSKSNSVRKSYDYNRDSYATDVIRRGHSHNDYHQKHPLISALTHGLRSIEVDVFPVGGELCVAHTRLELDETKTIDNMYIQPLMLYLQTKKSTPRKTPRQHSPFPLATTKRNYSRVVSSHHSNRFLNSKNNIGQLIDPHDDSLILMVDFKANPNLSAELLTKVIQPLKPFLSKVTNGKFVKGSVTILISGNRPQEDSLYVKPTLVDDIMKQEKEHHNLSTSNFRGADRNIEFCQYFRKTTNRLGNLFLHQTKRCPKRSDTDQERKGQERFLFIDGRIPDLHRQESTSLIPLISLNWSTVQLYRILGKGDEYMKKCADLAHSQGKQLRIWGAPNSESAWRSMIRNNIDWLSIDDHKRFATFASKLTS